MRDMELEILQSRLAIEQKESAIQDEYDVHGLQQMINDVYSEYSEVIEEETREQNQG
jgi:hypothetical protein